MKNIYLLILILFISLEAQNIEKGYNYIVKGEIEQAQNYIKELQKDFPGNPDVALLSAILEEDGKKAIQDFEDIIENHPESEAALQARAELIKYYYTTGLYHKTIEKSKAFITDNSDLEITGEIVAILLSSLKAIKRDDLIEFYKNEFSNNYPHLKPYIYESNHLSLYELKKQDRYTSDPQDSTQYAIQIGVFAKPENAQSILEQLKTKGYKAYLQRKPGSNNNQAVKIGPYPSRARANLVGKEIQRRFNLHYIIVRP